MKRRTEAVAVASGIAIVGAYIVLSMISGRGSVLARRPLLDGFTPPPPYKWVNPPQDVAAANKKPSASTLDVPLGPPRRGAGVFADKDAQVTFIIEPASFPASAGTGKAKLITEPIDPATLSATPPGGTVLDGNAYRLRLVLASGLPGPTLLNPGHLVMQYPQPPAESFTTEKHAVLRLDGQTWVSLTSTDSPAAQQATADIDTLGTFVVGANRPTPKAKPKSSPALFIGLGIAAVALLVGLRVFLAAKGRALKKGKPGARGKGQPARKNNGSSGRPPKKRR